MKTSFRDPTPTDKAAKESTTNKIFDFNCPPYDERSSSFISAGWDHGVGYKVPVGHKGNSKQYVDALPFDHKKGMHKVDRE